MHVCCMFACVQHMSMCSGQHSLAAEAVKHTFAHDRLLSSRVSIIAASVKCRHHKEASCMVMDEHRFLQSTWHARVKLQSAVLKPAPGTKAVRLLAKYFDSR